MVRNSTKADYLKANQNFFFWNLTVAAVLLIFIVFNFIQTNAIIENNYKLTIFQKTLKEKQEQNQNLQMSVLQLHSLRGLGEKAKEMNLVAIDKTEYLKTIPEIFALAKKP